MSIIDDPSLWATPLDVRPPPQWNGTAWEFAALTIYSSAGDVIDEIEDNGLQINYVGDAALPESLEFNFTYPVARDEAVVGLFYAFDGVLQQPQLEISSTGGNVAQTTVEIPAGTTEFAWQIFAYLDETSGAMPHVSGTTRAIGDGVESQEISFNCECDEESIERTLEDLRVALLRRLGFSAQAANPPPGMAELLDDFLRDAQEQLYMRYACFRTERYFRWVMQPGVRYYATRSNADLCTKKLNPYRISWAGVMDRDNSWHPLICGIPAVFYTSTHFQRMPSHYEVRDCIEVFPTPNDYYTLRIKGHIGLLPFSDDADQCTIDSHAVFLLALANAKAHYRQPDAANYFAQSNSYIGSLVAGGHHTRRYVPRMVERAPLTPPRMVRFDDE